MMDKPKEPGPTASAAEWSAYANAMAKYVDWTKTNADAPGEAGEALDEQPARTVPRQPPPPRKPAA